MGIKTIGMIALLAGAGYMFYPQISHKVGPYLPNSNTIVSGAKQIIGLEDSVKSEPESKKSSSFFDILFGPSTDSQLIRPDGTKMQSWNYTGNKWPSEWPIQNPDGSCNRDYLRWYEWQHKK